MSKDEVTAMSAGTGSDAVSTRTSPHIKAVSKKPRPHGTVHNMANKLLVIHRNCAETLVPHQASTSPAAPHSSPEISGVARRHSDHDSNSCDSASDIESEASSPSRTSRSLVAYRRNVVYEGVRVTQLASSLTRCMHYCSCH